MKSRAVRIVSLVVTTVCALGVCAPLVASAADAAAPAAPAHPQALKLFEGAGGKVEYLGSSHGLDGWIVTTDKGGVQTVYTTADGALVAGLLFSTDGLSETQKQLEAYKNKNAAAAPAVPDAAESKAAALYAAAEKAGFAALGAADAPYIYVFMNATCDHCQNFWKDLSPAVSAGKLQVRFLPYGATPANRDAGAALLAAANPQEAWTKFLSGDTAALDKSKATQDAYAKLDANTRLVNEWKLGTPPFTLYRRPADGALMAISGRPSNPLLLQADFLTGKRG